MENSSEESTHEKRLITLNAEVVRRGWCAGLHRTAGATRGLSAEQRPMLLDALDAEAARLAQVVGLSKSGPFSLLPNHPLAGVTSETWSSRRVNAALAHHFMRSRRTSGKRDVMRGRADGERLDASALWLCAANGANAEVKLQSSPTDSIATLPILAERA